MYYIAYGSNLNKEEMKQRCKDVKMRSLCLWQDLKTIHLHIVEILDELILQ